MNTSHKFFNGKPATVAVYTAVICFAAYVCIFCFRKAFNVAPYAGYNLWGIVCTVLSLVYHYQKVKTL